MSKMRTLMPDERHQKNTPDINTIQRKILARTYSPAITEALEGISRLITKACEQLYRVLPRARIVALHHETKAEFIYGIL
jgi:hypothetical protein